MVQFDLLPSLPPPPPPPSNSGDKSSLSDPGMGNCLRWSCPGGRGVGKMKNVFSLICEVQVISRAVYTMAADFNTKYL